MEKKRLHLRVPPRAIDQWLRVRKKIAERIEARGQEAAGAAIFCEAAALLEEALGAGPGTVEKPIQKTKPWTKLLPPQQSDPGRVREDQRDLAAQLRLFADRLEKGLNE